MIRHHFENCKTLIKNIEAQKKKLKKEEIKRNKKEERLSKIAYEKDVARKNKELKKLEKAEIERTRITKRPRFVCPHCNTMTDKANLTKWHFDKCKQNPLVCK